MADKTSRPVLKNMVRIQAGLFAMGCEAFYPEERPVRTVAIDSFWIDQHPVTVAEFRRFVKDTGYVTNAEIAPFAEDYPGADPELLVAGSLVFCRTAGPVDTLDYRNWWHWTPGACWRHPEGPGSTLHGCERHPVTHVAFADAQAYAEWAGKALPTEAEWEYAARGGLDGAIFTWGDDATPKGRSMANTWQGEFPWHNLLTDGYERTSPVGRFPANGYGLHDMAGNVWEWTADFFADHQGNADRPACCAPRNPRVPEPTTASYGTGPDASIPRRVIKGGSHLCAPNYCLRYRPAARQAEAIDTSTSHIGFRCVVRETSPAAAT